MAHPVTCRLLDVKELRCRRLKYLNPICKGSAVCKFIFFLLLVELFTNSKELRKLSPNGLSFLRTKFEPNRNCCSLHQRRQIAG